MCVFTHIHIYTYREKEREERVLYYKESAHPTMEAEKSLDLQSASWRPRGVVV